MRVNWGQIPIKLKIDCRVADVPFHDGWDVILSNRMTGDLSDVADKVDSRVFV